MYFPVGWVNTLKCVDRQFSNGEEEVIGVAFNQYWPLLAITTTKSLSVWTVKHVNINLLICSLIGM